MLVDPLLVTSGDPIQVCEAEVGGRGEGGQRWREPLVIRLGSNIIIIDVKMIRRLDALTIQKNITSTRSVSPLVY